MIDGWGGVGLFLSNLVVFWIYEGGSMMFFFLI